VAGFEYVNSMVENSLASVEVIDVVASLDGRAPLPRRGPALSISPGIGSATGPLPSYPLSSPLSSPPPSCSLCRPEVVLESTSCFGDFAGECRSQAMSFDLNTLITPYQHPAMYKVSVDEILHIKMKGIYQIMASFSLRGSSASATATSGQRTIDRNP
jgi:hypothetical protein